MSCGSITPIFVNLTIPSSRIGALDEVLEVDPAPAGVEQAPAPLVVDRAVTGMTSTIEQRVQPRGPLLPPDGHGLVSVRIKLINASHGHADRVEGMQNPDRIAVGSQHVREALIDLGRLVRPGPT